MLLKLVECNFVSFGCIGKILFQLVEFFGPWNTDSLKKKVNPNSIQKLGFLPVSAF